MARRESTTTATLEDQAATDAELGLEELPTFEDLPQSREALLQDLDARSDALNGDTRITQVTQAEALALLDAEPVNARDVRPSERCGVMAGNGPYAGRKRTADVAGHTRARADRLHGSDRGELQESKAGGSARPQGDCGAADRRGRVAGAPGRRRIEGYESRHSGTAVNSTSGARGWLQWLPSTARAWGVVIGDRTSEWTGAARIAARGEAFFRSQWVTIQRGLC
jgi:hypothetical protein